MNRPLQLFTWNDNICPSNFEILDLMRKIPARSLVNVLVSSTGYLQLVSKSCKWCDRNLFSLGFFELFSLEEDSLLFSFLCDEIYRRLFKANSQFLYERSLKETNIDDQALSRLKMLGFFCWSFSQKNGEVLDEMHVHMQKKLQKIRQNDFLTTREESAHNRQLRTVPRFFLYFVLLFVLNWSVNFEKGTLFQRFSRSSDHISLTKTHFSIDKEITDYLWLIKHENLSLF